MSESQEEAEARMQRLAESDRIYREALANNESPEAAAAAAEAVLPEK
ncbi:hypothetical protein GCM10010187_44130 [Actinomadura coerulea]|nr:hypothetical protein GCM10010187_44130 [Actinomadura coerulea]